MKTFSVSRHLPIEPARVWAVLTNAKKLASGPLGITRLEGNVALGQRLTLWTQATGSRPFKLTVSTMDAGQRMVWEGGMPFGLFNGVRRFTLTPRDGGVQFEMSETFSGPLARFIVPTIPDLTPSFEQFATGLLALAQKE